MVSSYVAAWYGRIERFVPALIFIGGFVWDNIMLTRIDLWIDDLVLFSYLCIAGGGMVLINAHQAGRFSKRYESKLHWLPHIVQFTLGGLFSSYVIFYTRSASLTASWIFLLILAGLFVGNEFFHKKYFMVPFQVAIYYVTLFSFAIFFVPIVVGSIGPKVFLLSGAISLLVALLYVHLLLLVARKQVKKHRVLIVGSVLGIFLLFNGLYFANIIPPIPLSLEAAGMYHSVERLPSGDYGVTYERGKWYQILRRSDSVFHAPVGDPMFCFSAVYAPTRLTTPIVHHWYYYDQNKKSWVSSGTISFHIVGGRDGGYRGYSQKSAVTPGKWRCDIETDRGQLIGRVSVVVVSVTTTPPLVSGVE